jgi:hypothetical protein
MTLYGIWRTGSGPGPTQHDLENASHTFLFTNGPWPANTRAFRHIVAVDVDWASEE